MARRPPARRTRHTHGLWLGTAAVGIALLTLGAAWLRETPMFWRTAGGYPVWLRDAVRAGFVPLAAVDVALSWRVWTLAVRSVRAGRRPHWAQSVQSAALVAVNAVAALLVLEY